MDLKAINNQLSGIRIEVLHNEDIWDVLVQVRVVFLRNLHYEI